MKAAMKPIPSIRLGLPSVDLHTGEATQATYQRSDVTSVPACSVVGEAMVALELVDAFLEKYGGDSMGQVGGLRFHRAPSGRGGGPGAISEFREPALTRGAGPYPLALHSPVRSSARGGPAPSTAARCTRQCGSIGRAADL